MSNAVQHPTNVQLTHACQMFAAAGPNQPAMHHRRTLRLPSGSAKVPHITFVFAGVDTKDAVVGLLTREQYPSTPLCLGIPMVLFFFF